MAKRFYNTQRIEEDWYINLSCKHRELLRYCESKCDGAGIFSWNAKIASTYIGEKITDSDLELLPISKLDNGKYFIHGFCFFQNGNLSRKSPAHNSVFKSIEENNTTESVLFCRVVDTLQSREQEEEREIEEDKEVEKVKEEIKDREEKFKETIRPFIGIYSKEMCIKFFTYWSEPNKTNTKMRFELEKTWEISRRLLTWSNNNKNFDNAKQIRKGQPDTADAVAWANSVLSGGNNNGGNQM